MIPTFRASAPLDADALLRWLGGLRHFDTLFLHANSRRRAYTLARGTVRARRRDEVVPSACEYVARVGVDASLSKSDADRVWNVLCSKVVVLSVDPRTAARREGYAGERRLAFVRSEIRSGALPNRPRLRRALAAA